MKKLSIVQLKFVIIVYRISRVRTLWDKRLDLQKFLRGQSVKYIYIDLHSMMNLWEVREIEVVPACCLMSIPTMSEP